MNNTQLGLAIGLPTLLVLCGLLLNWSATRDVARRLGVIEDDFRQFYRATRRGQIA